MIYWGLDPGKTTFGMACFRDGKLKAIASFVNRKRKGHEVPEGQEARWCAVIACAWMEHMRALFSAPSRLQECLISEFPQIYYDDNKKNDRNDLLHLAACIGAIEATNSKTASERVSPKKWKHNLDKDMQTRRITHLLMQNPEEASVVDTFKLRITNVKHQSHGLDAAGIVLWKLGRLPR